MLHVPERLVKFKGDSTFVNLKGVAKTDSLVRHPVKIGFSDGLNVEVIEGLKAGQKVVDN